LCSQNHSKTVPKQPPLSPAVLPAPPHTVAATAPSADAAPLRRRCCRFGLIDLTWVCSKVVVAYG